MTVDLAVHPLAPPPASWPAGVRIVYADPPWRWQTRSPKGHAGGKTPEAHYPTLPTPVLCDVWRHLGLDAAVAPDCALALWARWPMLPDALDVMAAWGFVYVTGLPWIKRASGGGLQVSTGYWLRGVSEVLLIGKRGRPRLQQTPLGIVETDCDDPIAWAFGGIIEAPRGRHHSEKPQAARTLLESLLSPPGVELFGRHELSDGWQAWGNQVGTLGRAQ